MEEYVWAIGTIITYETVASTWTSIPQAMVIANCSTHTWRSSNCLSLSVRLSINDFFAELSRLDASTMCWMHVESISTSTRTAFDYNWSVKIDKSGHYVYVDRPQCNGEIECSIGSFDLSIRKSNDWRNNSRWCKRKQWNASLSWCRLLNRRHTPVRRSIRLYRTWIWHNIRCQHRRQHHKQRQTIVSASMKKKDEIIVVTIARWVWLINWNWFVHFYMFSSIASTTTTDDETQVNETENEIRSLQRWLNRADATNESRRLLDATSMSFQ